jgi:hypothetical protein
MNQQKINLNIDPNNMKPVTCDKCKIGRIFLQAVELRHASTIQCGIPGGKILPVPVYICIKCQYPHFMTKPIKKEE